MPKTRQQKEEVVKRLEAELKAAKGAALSSFRGLTVSADQELRRSMRQHNISYAVVKKTLLTKIFAKLNLPVESFSAADANISLAVSSDDEVAAARTAHNFAQSNETFKIIGGMLESVWIDAGKVTALAQLPSKDELIAKTVGSIKAPLNGFVNVLAGNLRGLVNVLNAVKDQKA